MSTAHKFPTLYGLSKGQSVKVWDCRVDQESDGTCKIVIHHGYEGGVQQETIRKIESGKNLGRMNATSTLQQALSEASSLRNKKIDENYREEVPTQETITLLPMLAQKFKDQSHKIKWPAYAQPKLNGLRMLAKKVSDTEIAYVSRKGKEFETLQHLTPYLLKLLDVDQITDGEAFNPNLSLQQIVSRVKRVKTSREDIANDPIQYWIYDLVDTREPFEGRTVLLHKQFYRLNQVNGNCPLVYVDTQRIRDKYELNEYHGWNVERGFEGTMIRNTAGLYVPDYRSYDLQKVKDWQEDEFVIIGGHEGRGKDEGTIVFSCRAKNGNNFDCRPKGTYEERAYWWQNLQTLVGKQLTVRYQYLTADGIPFHPVGIGLREDLV